VPALRGRCFGRYGGRLLKMAKIRFADPALFRRVMALALAIVVADQASKWFLLNEVLSPPRVIELLPVLNIVMAWNPGVSFSLFQESGPMLLSGIAILVSLGLIFWATRLTSRLPSYAIGLIVGGATGNVIDRFRMGAVFDFIDFHVGGWHWPAFNLADSAISIGVALLLIDGLFQGKDRGKNGPRPEVP
jgi:signal peptidase II